jgi:Fic family protein
VQPEREITLGNVAGDETAELALWLTGTPYMIEADSSVNLKEVVGVRLRVFSARAALLASKYASEALYPLRVTHRVREVYESNAIEGLGLGLVETEQTIRGMAKLPALDVTRFTVAHSLASDKHVYDVIGLQYARELADLIAGNKTRPITESDLRNMHSMILGQAPGSGIYKRYVNSISGSEHQPPPPSDVPAHMQNLTAWLSASNAHPLVQATVAHAWLTHVHPFEDGNGRMARLMMNLILARAGYPPIIIKANSHRQSYMDALADSDSGGDILPLLGIFSRLLKVTFRQVERPGAALGIWRRQLEDNQPSAFIRWRDEVEEFIATLREELPEQLIFARTGTLDQEDYAQLSSGSYFIAPRIVKITHAEDEEFELQIIAIPPSKRALNYSRHPILRFLQKSRDPRDWKTHRSLRTGRAFKYDEVVLRPEGLPSVLLLGGQEVLPSGIKSSAAALSDQIVTWSTTYRDRPLEERIFTRGFKDRSVLHRYPKPRATKTRFQREFDKSLYLLFNSEICAIASYLP